MRGSGIQSHGTRKRVSVHRSFARQFSVLLGILAYEYVNAGMFTGGLHKLHFNRTTDL